MPKTTAPLLSFGASGQIGKTLVASKWKGRAYMRQYVVPSNPQSSEQTITRSVFSTLQSAYKTAPALFTAPWAAYARGKVLTDRNAFTKFNLAALRGESDLANFVFSPGALGGLVPASLSAVAGNDIITCTITAPTTLPTGWTISRAVAACIIDQDPEAPTDLTITAGEDTTSTYEVVLSGLSAVAYRVGAWFVYTRPDGTLAYSPSIYDTATPT